MKEAGVEIVRHVERANYSHQSEAANSGRLMMEAISRDN